MYSGGKLRKKFTNITFSRPHRRDACCRGEDIDKKFSMEDETRGKKKNSPRENEKGRALTWRTALEKERGPNKGSEGLPECRRGGSLRVPAAPLWEWTGSQLGSSQQREEESIAQEKGKSPVLTRKGKGKAAFTRKKTSGGLQWRPTNAGGFRGPRRSKGEAEREKESDGGREVKRRDVTAISTRNRGWESIFRILSKRPQRRMCHREVDIYARYLWGKGLGERRGPLGSGDREVVAQSFGRNAIVLGGNLLRREPVGRKSKVRKKKFRWGTPKVQTWCGGSRSGPKITALFVGRGREMKLEEKENWKGLDSQKRCGTKKERGTLAKTETSVRGIKRGISTSRRK